MTTTTDFKANIKTDGYVVIPNVLNQKEIQKLRYALQKHFRSGGSFFSLGLIQGSAHIHIKDIEWILCHQRIVEALRDVLGQDNIVFLDHCDAHHNVLRDWHKDYGGDKYFQEDYYTTNDCLIYKVAIYLQDHLEQGGLSVRKGSHRFSSTTAGDVEHCSMKAGDLIIFDIRLTHSGQSPPDLITFFYNGWKKIPLLRRKDRWFYKLRIFLNRIGGYEDRAAILFSFGIPNSFMENFVTVTQSITKEMISDGVVR